MVIRAAASIVPLCIAIVGLTVTLGWFFNLAPLKSILLDASSMKFSTSIAFACSGVALFFIAELLNNSRTRIAALGHIAIPPMLLVVILFMSVHIASAILGRSAGIDNMFGQEAITGTASTASGRPSEPTILSFLLIAISGVTTLASTSFSRGLMLAVGLAVASIGGMAVAGYALGLPFLYYELDGLSNAMAVHTAILFVATGGYLVIISKVLGRTKSTMPAEMEGEAKTGVPLMSIRTKFTGMIFTASVIPVLFVGGIALRNSQSLPVDLLGGSIAVLGSATAISVTFFALALSKSMSEPLISLKQTIHQFAIGNYQEQIKVNSTDEIGMLASDVALLKRRVVETNRNLERLVESRTLELSASKKQLEILVSQLKEQERVMKEFISVAAHELKNPIAPILMASQLFAKREIDNKITLTRAELDLIGQNAIRLKRLCEDILDVARIESNGIKLEKTRFDMLEVLQISANEARPVLKQGVDFKIAGSECVVEADRDKVQQVIQNFFHNAAKFTASGTIEVSLGLTSDSEAIVKVKDCGSGIDPEILPRLFTKYATKSEKGTGLGLFISKNIIEAHGGRIWAENNSDAGATFAFSLPQRLLDNSEVGQQAEAA